MKKVILVLSIIVTLILNLLIIDTAKSFSIYSSVEKDKQKIQLYLNNVEKTHAKDALKYFEMLSKKYHVTFTKVTYVNDNKLIIGSNDSVLKKNVTKNNDLELFDSKLNIKVYDLNGTNLSEEGTYYLKGKNVQKVIDIIDRDVGKVVEVDNSIYTVLPTDTFMVIYLILLLVIYITVLIHYLKNRKSDIKLLYDVGYDRRQMTKYIISQHRNYLICYALLSILVTYVVYYAIYHDFYLVKPISIMFVVLFMMFLLSYIIFQVVLTQFVKSYAQNKKQSNTFVMMYTYMLLSIVVVVFLIASTDKLIENFTDYQKQSASIQYWDTTKDIYQTNVFDIGQITNKDFNAVVNRRLKEHYMSEDNNGFVVETSNFLDRGGTPYFKLNELENSEIEPDGQTITVDKAYLKRHSKKTVDNENVLNKIIDNENTLNILVPVAFKKYEKELNENFLSYLKSKKYIEKASDVSDKGLNVNIIWVRNDIQYFTYYFETGGIKNTIVAPIAMVEVGQTNALNFEGYYSTTYYFESHLDNPYETIHEGLRKHQLDGVIPSVMAVYDTKVDIVKELKAEIYKYTGLALLTSITFIITTLTFIQIYFKSYQFQIFLKRSLGYSYWSIHKWMLLFLVMLHVLMGSLLLTSHNIIAISVFASITLIEALSVTFTFMKLNRENVNLVLKGKKDD